MLEEALTDFGREFFEKATEKVSEAADNSIHFEMPKIIVARRRTHEEEEEYYWLIGESERRDMLSKLVPEDAHGKYLHYTNQILIAQKDTDENEATAFEIREEVLTHELMHAIRSRVMGENETIYINPELQIAKIPLKVIEFFSQLNAPACDSLGIKIKKDHYPSLDELLKGITNDWQPDTLLEEIKKLKTLYDKSKGVFEFRKRREVSQKAKKLEAAEKYLYFACELSKTVTCLAGYMAQNMYLSSGCNLWKEKYITEVNSAFEVLMNQKEIKEENELDKKIRQYRTAKLAIGERYSELMEEWPRIMGMEARDVETKYITPIHAALADLIHEITGK